MSIFPIPEDNPSFFLHIFFHFQPDDDNIISSSKSHTNMGIFFESAGVYSSATRL
jgi:hypothetical protein